MHVLPSVFALVAALVVAPALHRSLTEEGFTRENYRGRQVVFPFGIVVIAAAFVALIPTAIAQQLSDGDVYSENFGYVLLFVPAVALLGLVDDAFSSASRGWRGHGKALLNGEFSTGTLKAVGTLGLALLVASGLSDGLEPLSDGEFLLAAAVLVVTTNVFNLFDLRPGRSVKAFALLAAGLTIGSWDTDVAEALGLFAVPVLVAGFYDLRERAMLGDTGSNLIGALAGLWLVLTLDTTGQVIALAVLLCITAYGEFRSISAFVERTPGLRHLDSIGRPA